MPQGTAENRKPTADDGFPLVRRASGREEVSGIARNRFTLRGVPMDFFGLIIGLTVLVIVVILLFWLLQQIPLPEPAAQIVKIVLVVVVALAAIGFLLRFAGHGSYIGFP